MSRPKNPVMIRSRLLDAGLAAFAKRGYHGTDIKEIVDTAQIPKGSFYNYPENGICSRKGAKVAKKINAL